MESKSIAFRRLILTADDKDIEVEAESGIDPYYDAVLNLSFEDAAKLRDWLNDVLREVLDPVQP